MTGCAGFVGSHLVDRLLADGHEVVGYDNLSTGRARFLEGAAGSPRFRLVRGDTLDSDRMRAAMGGADMVFHMAANADVRFGIDHPRRDLEQNTIATANVLEAMRANGVRRIAFASTGSVYGEPDVFPTPETCPFPVQTSLYGASKVAAEGQIAAYCAGFGFQSWVFRFVSILGERYSHGHVCDFYRKLLADPREIEILGDGRQRKSYLYVGDCVEGMMVGVQRADAACNVFNLGTDEYCTVDESLGWICEELGVDPRRRYTGGARGWIGDSPFIFLDTTRIRALGWRPRLSIQDGVLRTLEYLERHPHLFDVR